jgi:spore cortex formation protein SpoVR/YcgB (stage V sporulation)
MSKLLYKGSEWDIPLLESIWEEIDVIGKSYNLDYYTPQIEIVSFDQMISNCSTGAMPSMIDHWTFGLEEMKALDAYRKTGSGLAFEVVINTDPAIAYCQENNSTTMQTLVMAHAICGHSSFFKNNYMFKEFTQADQILPRLEKFKQYLHQCEARYGSKSVEWTLDACFTLQLHAFNSAPRYDMSFDEAWEQMLERINYNEELSGNQSLLRIKDKEQVGRLLDNDFYNPNENVLAVILKYSTKLKPWQKKILEQFCYMQQYFYPQYLTKVMNEGWATFWHTQILTDMHDKGLIDNSSMLEVIDMNSRVLYQPPYSAQMNPYTLGYEMFMDIKRICEAPDEEDKRLFPTIAGSNWKETLFWAMKNYNDNSFIMQYLSPKVVKKLGLAKLDFNVSQLNRDIYNCTRTSDEADLHEIRSALAATHEMDNMRPRITAMSVKVDQVNRLVLDIPNDTETGDLQASLKWLWGNHYKL